MPKYDYKCDSCDEVEEMEHSISEDANGVPCRFPKCKGHLNRIISTAPGTHFKGQGWGKIYRVHKPKGK